MTHAGKVYVRLDVDYWHNPRIMAVGARAEHLYVRALCFAKLVQSDGLLTEGQIAACARGIRNWRALIPKLIDAGLWEPSSDGWRIVGYLERNRSRQEVSDLSEKRAQAGRIGGLRSGESRSNEQRTDSERTASGHLSEPNAEQVASQNRHQHTDSGQRTDHEPNPETESETETSQSQRDLREGSANLRGDPPVDALKRRCLEHFAPKGIGRDDCVRAVDRLRAEDIADEIIDAAIGAAIKRDADSPGFVVTVARDWYLQRAGGAA